MSWKWMIYAVMFILVAVVTSGQLYNITNITNADNLLAQTIALNDVADNLIGYSILAITFFVPFTMIMSRTQDPLKSLATASFFTAIIATVLMPLGLLALWAYTSLIVITAVAVLATIWTGRAALR